MTENINWNLISSSTAITSDSNATSAGQLPRPIVLVVDDDRVVHMIAARVLGSMPVSAVYAHDGAQALQMANELKPDLIITDALLPKLDGRELCRIVKTSPATAGCKVAVMTALYKAMRYRNEAFHTFKADEFIEKPLSPEKLRHLVSHLLGIAPTIASAPARTESPLAMAS